MELLIYGEISPYSLNASAEGVAYALRQAAPNEPLTVRVHSPGGSPYEVGAIRAQLEAHKGPKTVLVDGLAASAAAHLLCMPGARVEMSDGAWAMIHNTSGAPAGEADDLERAAAQLRAIDQQTAELFARRTGKTVAQIAALMSATTWLSAQSAVDAGFADAVVSAPAGVLQRFNARAWDGAPRQALDKWTEPHTPCESDPMALDKEIKQRLKLPESATDAEVFAALDKASVPKQETPAPVAAPAAPAALTPPEDLDAKVAKAVAAAFAAVKAPEAHSLAVQTAVDSAIATGKVRPADRVAAIALCGSDAKQLASTVAYWTAAPSLVNAPIVTEGAGVTQALTATQKAMCVSAGISEEQFRKQIAKENAK